MDVIHRDVEEELLLKKRKHRRQEGHAIYCFPYTRDMVDFDNWDFMFQRKYYCQHGLTMHQFETPPQMILDLGCGGALWTIEAAKQWKVKDNCGTCHSLRLQTRQQDSKIVGFDFLDNLQPKIGLPEDIAQRIKWVRGNLCVQLIYADFFLLSDVTSLEKLPFPSDYFDFIRCVRLTYHLPEDEVRGIRYTHSPYSDVLFRCGLIRAWIFREFASLAHAPNNCTEQTVLGAPSHPQTWWCCRGETWRGAIHL
jgi:SAM-dependent methyltransferase